MKLLQIIKLYKMNIKMNRLGGDKPREYKTFAQFYLPKGMKVKPTYLTEKSFSLRPCKKFLHESLKNKNLI
mgnify:CR=1 FL=1